MEAQLKQAVFAQIARSIFVHGISKEFSCLNTASYQTLSQGVE